MAFLEMGGTMSVLQLERSRPMKSAVPKLLLGFALALFAAPLSAFADG